MTLDEFLDKEFLLEIKKKAQDLLAYIEALESCSGLKKPQPSVITVSTVGCGEGGTPGSITIINEKEEE